MNNPQMLINNIANMLHMTNNPNQIIEQMIRTNPQANILLNQMKNSGMTPQQYVMQYAKQNNINIQPILNGLSQKGIKL